MDRRTQIILQVESLLKGYYPQVLQVAGDLKSDVALAFRNRWPDLISLKAARPATCQKSAGRGPTTSAALVRGLRHATLALP
ncbi:MAG TPA: hypothetical protein VGY56_20560 [Verrucomicrobiae bacterium]|nr:hypothetical protein [Verrucomicrobiae bacterium]